MGLFYKYKCKKCGKRYFELPVTCGNCGTELSIICPLSNWLINPEYKRSNDCEEIYELAFALCKSKKTREFEEKIRGLNVLLESKQDEMHELESKWRELVNGLKETSAEKWALRDVNSRLSAENISLKRRIDRYESIERFNAEIKIPQGTMEAVKYAMTRAHPDNGGKEEDFIKFREVYEKLTGK